ncbi:hypothetical protein QTO34_019021 [Cnephaeus nilssonii]|uniref:Small ribosomal subunit protein uS15 n=1 Tax=Cnephaeus nilssonii TaxID=3371016 RepID=A0AA40HZW2_CNENI|nr:hypothetical protein QTO34_019021 [Eptesicus nilssonii]
MGRMHAPRKGLSQSALPYCPSVPTWLKLTSDNVKEQIHKLAKKGLTPSQISVLLRDAHGVAQVRFVTGSKILRILKSKKLAPDLPEDLYHLIKKVVTPWQAVLAALGVPHSGPDPEPPGAAIFLHSNAAAGAALAGRRQRGVRMRGA